MEFDHRLFATEMAGMVKEFAARAVAPISARLDAIEHRLNALPAPSDPEIPILRLRETFEARLSRFEEDVKAAYAKAEAAVKDGVNLAGAVIDRDGNLILMLSNGEQRSLGCIVGKDGAPGASGKDGRDGFGFDDLAAEYDGERTLKLRFIRGDLVKEFSLDLPIVLYRGVYRPGDEYREGDSVTYGGSQWVARRATSAKPEASDDWRLAVKRGRDGKDGQDGAPGPQGVEGRPGRDLTQMGLDGRKWGD